MTSGSIIILPGSFMILLTCIFFFSPFPVFLKFVYFTDVFKELALCLFFCILSLFSDSLIFFLFALSFYLLWFILLFSRLWMEDLIIGLRLFSSFQVYTRIAINFPLSTILASAKPRVGSHRLISIWIPQYSNDLEGSG